jgi:hypothetical protein
MYQVSLKVRGTQYVLAAVKKVWANITPGRFMSKGVGRRVEERLTGLCKCTRTDADQRWFNIFLLINLPYQAKASPPPWPVLFYPYVPGMVQGFTVFEGEQ